MNIAYLRILVHKSWYSPSSNNGILWLFGKFMIKVCFYFFVLIREVVGCVTAPSCVENKHIFQYGRKNENLSGTTTLSCILNIQIGRNPQRSNIDCACVSQAILPQDPSQSLRVSFLSPQYIVVRKARLKEILPGLMKTKELMGKITHDIFLSISFQFCFFQTLGMLKQAKTCDWRPSEIASRKCNNEIRKCIKNSIMEHKNSIFQGNAF